VKAKRKVLVATALCFFHTRSPASASPELPGPVPFPTAPRSLADLPEFERKLALVQGAFWEFKNEVRPPSEVSGEIFLEAKPEEVPLRAGEALIGCNAYLAKVRAASEAWEHVEALSEQIRFRIESLRSETDAGLLAKGFERVATLVGEASTKADRIAEDFPATLFSTPDRLIRYSWLVQPQDLLSTWEPGWRLEGSHFDADVLSLPGYTWAGQGRVTDVAQVTRAPYAAGRNIVFERLATPASTCVGPETVWMHGRARVTYKRPMLGNPGCPGGDACASVQLDPVVFSETITVTLLGRPEPLRPSAGAIAPSVSSKVCPKPQRSRARPPIDCPH